jgi:DNA-binding NarL/FixJ family response regulator
MGLPEPWQDGDVTFWGDPVDRLAADARRARPLPPLPDPARAAALWNAGRRVPIADAVADALTVDLAAPPAHSADDINPLGWSAPHQLSPRKQDVLALLCQRLTDPQIATRLFISPRTVESHVASILRKLDVENRRDAAAAAARLGLV